MATASLLRAFLAIVKALLSSCKRLVNDTRVRLLQKVAYLWTLLKTLLSRGKTTKSIDPKKGQEPSPSPPPATTPACDDPTEKLTTETNSTTITTTRDDVIPLDSSIACSLHPYPYMNRSNASRASLHLGLNIARSAHTSRNASRSTQHLPASPSGSHSYQEDYTFTVKSPDTPISPITRRQWSLSSPQLGSRSGSGQGEGEGRAEGEATNQWGFGIIDRTHSSSPAESVLALPAGAPSIHAESHRVASPNAESLCHEDLKLGHDRIFPIVPEFFQRYDRKAFSDDKATSMTITAFTLDFRPQPDPPGWRPIVHPEGVLYFYNEEKNAVTEADLYNHLYLDQVKSDIATLEDFIRSRNLRMPDNYTLAMDMNMQPHGEIYTDYYFADHDRRIVFFLDDIDAQANLPVWGQLTGVTSLAHLKHEIEAQYWHHGVLYPSTVELTLERVVDLRDVILHYLGDIITSHYSTSPYSASELNTMLGQVNGLQKNVGHRSPGAVNLLSRMMLIFSRQKFLNWHGVPEARIYRDQSVHGEHKRKTLLIKILSPLLFSAPDVHLRTLKKMWVDGLMHGPVWQDTIKKLNDEWQEFILYATVLLNANVAYLSIQSIDTPENKPTRNPVQIGCYLSTVASIGSIILGLLLMRQNRSRMHGTMDEVNHFLKARSHPRLGLETLAILYSLPYALLLWGMVSFLAAFGWNCFDGSNTPTRVILGAAWGALAILVLWCVWMGWVKQPDEPSPEGGEPAAAGEDAQSHTSPSRAGSTRNPSRVSVHELDAITPETATGNANQSTVGEMTAFKFWRNWSFFGGDRRTSYDSQTTAVNV